MTSPVKTKNAILWNANGMMNKTHDLDQYIKKEKPGWILITETHLRNERKPPKIMNYRTIHKNRRERGGGVAMYIHETINFQEIEVRTQNVEAIAAKCGDIVICCCYNKPSLNLDPDELEEIFAHQRILVAGDFNAKHQAWGNTTTNTSGRTLLRYTNDNGLTINAPDEATHIPSNAGTESTIDIIVTKNTPVTKVEAINELSSDHLPVTFEMRCQLDYEERERKAGYNYTAAKWKEYRRSINEKLQMTREFQSEADINNKVIQITKIINEAAEEHVPKTKQNEQNIPQEIQEIIKYRNRTRRQFQRHRTQEYQERLRELNAEINTRIWSYKEEQWHQRINKIQNRRQNVWKLIKNRKRGPNEIPTLKLNGREYTTTDEKINLIAQQYVETTQMTLNLSDITTRRLVERTCNNIRNASQNTPNEEQTSPREIKGIINKMRPHKAPGDDNIQPILLKNLPKKMTVQLYYIYKECMNKQTFPEAWKNARIIPLKKPGKKKDQPSSYRPISLLPVLGKILERIIHNRLQKHLEENKTIIPEQFAFGKAKNAELQAARVVNEAKENFNKNKYTSFTTLDIEKAYDTVWRDGLSYKLEAINTPMYIQKLVISYIKDRTVQVTHKSKVSTKVTTAAGLPQGSVISPTLFNIFINDIPKNDQTQLALFADDTAVMASSTKEGKCREYAQRHLEEITEYFKKWKLQINAEKTKTITFSQKRTFTQPDTKIKISDTDIQESEKVKYLGIILDRKLLFKEHIKDTKGKAYAVKSIISPYLNKTNPLSQNLKVQLYKAYVRSVIMYGAPIWSSTAKTNRKPLTVVENNCLRQIAGKTRNEISNEELHAQTKIEPIEDKIKSTTRKFYKYKTQQNEITKNIGRFTKDAAPFKVKHRLINSLLQT